MTTTGNGDHAQGNGAEAAGNGAGNGALRKRRKGRKRGPKTKWGKIDPVKVAALAGKLGASRTELAAALNVTPQTLRNWEKENRKLFCALENAKAQKDNQVVQSLFERATGYRHKSVKIMVVNGKVAKVPYTEHYAPDTAAAVFWLKNRAGDKWRDKTESSLSNADGSPIGGTTVIAPTVVFIQPKKEELTETAIDLPALGNGNGNGGSH